MRQALLVTNATLAVLFAGFFAYTFAGRQHIDSIAREFVAAKTQEWAAPAVDAASEALGSELVRRLLTQDQLAAIEAEIAAFRSQPASYVQRLVSDTAAPKPGSFSAKLAEKIYGWKEGIRKHFNQVMRRLITDLRIFSGSNVAAAVIAFICAWRSPQQPGVQLTLISGLLLAAMSFCVYAYIDSFSFFTILFDWYVGWWYPVMIASWFIIAYVDFGLRGKSKPA